MHNSESYTENNEQLKSSNDSTETEFDIVAYRQRLLDQMHGGAVERQANYRGNFAELQFSRMSDQGIRNKYLDVLEENEKWLAQHPGTDRVLKRDPETDMVLEDDNGLPIFEVVQATYTPKSRDELEDELLAVLEHERSVTAIDAKATPLASGARLADADAYSKGLSRRREAVMGVAPPGDDVRMPAHQRNIHMSMIEAHEKGHALRNFSSSGYFKDTFQNAFSLDAIDPHLYYAEMTGSGYVDSSDIKTEDILDTARDYFSLENPTELVERMAQLKNYFGFKGSEVFTHSHLQYAREHYVEDGHIDNHMKTFFSLITPEKESAFVELMNSFGI